MNKRQKGSLGEDIAVEYLKKKGYRILERNFFCQVGEIDIIASKDKILSFIEVKYRNTKDFGSPLLAIDNRKINKIRRVIEFYCLKKKIKDMPLRIEVVGIIKENDSINIEHIENIF